MINTALIQEQIDFLSYDIQQWSRIRDLCQTTVQLEGAKGTINRLEEKRDQWQAILAAVEQQGKQEPYAYFNRLLRSPSEERQ